MYKMPAEYQPHRATLMIWPVRPGSWGKDPRPAQAAFVRVFEAITQGEDLYLLAGPGHLEEARAATAHLDPARVHLLCIDSDDAWARDVGPTFVQDEAGRLKGISWRFNAWGGEVDGLYADWQKDDAVASAFCDAAGYPWEDAAPFVLEGGSIHTDGEGTALVTESCLLSAGRNPSLSRQEIEAELCRRLGVGDALQVGKVRRRKRVLWVGWVVGPGQHHFGRPHKGADVVHVFVGLVVVDAAWQPQHFADAQGRRLKIHKLPIPDHPILCSEADCDAYEFAPGEDTREPGERLAASYVNFYFVNGAVLVPQFGGENAASDARACAILQALCPDRRVIGLPARDILQGGGNIHCITQQIPL